jgi:hypothetical protein
MSAAQLKAIALGVLVLLVLWGASELLRHGSDPTAGTLGLPKLTPGDVDTITITHGADTIVLAKASPSAWTVNRFPASSANVAELFHALRDSVKPELAAESPTSFARMGVDSSGGRLVRVTGGGRTLARLLVGGSGPGYDASYVRVPGDARVFLWRNDLPSLVGRPADDWREHRIGGVTPDSVAAVEVRLAVARYTLRKHDRSWSFSTGAAADTAAVARFLERFRNVSAAGFATARQADSVRWARARRGVSLWAAGDRLLLKLEFDSTAAGYWTRTPGGATVYRLDSWQAEQLTPNADTFKPGRAAR